MRKKVRNLFPEINEYHRVPDRLRYVKDRLGELVDANDLCATELINQKPGAREMIGCVITGMTIENRRFATDGSGRVPPALMNHPVKIVSIERNGKKHPIRFKTGFREVEDEYRFVGQGINRTGVPVMEEAWEYPCGEDATQGTVGLRDAWDILQQKGEFCVPAGSERLQQGQWLYREIHSALVDSQPKKKTSGKQKGLSL